MKIHTTAREDYLKAVYVLKMKLGKVRSIDVARYPGLSKPSVCKAVSVLTKGGFLTMDDEYLLHLTESGVRVAASTYEKHCFFTKQLIALGVDEAAAEEDACRLEHAISESSFNKLKAKLEA